MTETIARLDPHAPDGAGLEPWEEIPADALVSGTPVQRGVTVHEDSERGLSVGVWDCTAMTTKQEPYSVNEFMLLLEGAVTIVDAEGGEVTISAGQPFVIPKGLDCTWHQAGYVRKFFVIFDDPSGAAAADPAALSVIRPDPYGPPEALSTLPVDPAAFTTAAPLQREHVCYRDPTGQFLVGTWDATPYERPVSPFPRNELMHILEGEVTLTGDQEQTFRAGDTFFVPQGTLCGWRSETYVRKYFCGFKIG